MSQGRGKSCKRGIVGLIRKKGRHGTESIWGDLISQKNPNQKAYAPFKGTIKHEIFDFAKMFANLDSLSGVRYVQKIQK